MASKISFKQLGTHDITPYFGGQVFTKLSNITTWETDIPVVATQVFLHNNNQLSQIQKENVKLIWILDDTTMILVGVGLVRSYDIPTDTFTLNAVEYGKDIFNIYETTDTLSTAINGLTPLAITDLVVTGLTVNDLELKQFVYDADGTVGIIHSINTTTGVFEVKTITTANEDWMPIAPDVKELNVEIVGNGYTVGDVIETTTPGVFCEINGVDINGAITSVVLSTATAATTTNVTGQVDYDQVIYGGYGSNWAALSQAAVLVAIVLHDSFTYDTGYSYIIINPGTGYVVGDIIQTSVSGEYVEVMSVGTSGDITSVEFTRNTTASTSGSGATIDAVLDPNVFIIPDSYWNNETSMFAVTNDVGANVTFVRTGDATEKYCIGGDSNIYKFEFNNVKGYITQSATSIVATGGAITIEGVFATAPTTCAVGDIYYDSTTNMLYEATAVNTWSTTGTLPVEDVVYISENDTKLYGYVGGLFKPFSGSVQVSSKSDNAIQEITGSTIPSEDGLYVEDLQPQIDAIPKYQKYLNTDLDYTVANINQTNALSYTRTMCPIDIVFDTIDSNMTYSASPSTFTCKAGKRYEIKFSPRIGVTSAPAQVSFHVKTVSGTIVAASTATTMTATDMWSEREGLTIVKFDTDTDIKVIVHDINSTTSTLSSLQATLTITEIGRTVTIDPVEYVDTTSGLQDSPVGHIISTMSNSAPKHYLKCDGSVYNIADYPYLAEHFKTEFGTYNYFGGDGVTTFAVPDLQGEFLRGTGTNSHTGNGNGAAVGKHQDSTQLPAQYTYLNGAGSYTGNTQLTFRMDDGRLATDGHYGIWNYDKTVPLTGSIRGLGVKTASLQEISSTMTFASMSIRPTNTSVLYCIKYEPTYYLALHGWEVVDELLSTPYTAPLTTDSAITVSDTVTLDKPIHDYDRIEFIVAGKDTASGGTFYRTKIDVRVEDIVFTTTGVLGDGCYQLHIQTIVPAGILSASICYNFRDDYTLDITRIGYRLAPTSTVSYGWTDIEIMAIRGIKNKFEQCDGGGSASLNTYSTTIVGDGTTNIFTINHNLNTLKLSTSVYDTTTLEEVAYELKRIDANNVEISWGDPIPTGTDYQVDILGW